MLVKIVRLAINDIRIIYFMITKFLFIVNYKKAHGIKNHICRMAKKPDFHELAEIFLL